MQGRRSLKRKLAPIFDNIHRPRKLELPDLEEEDSSKAHSSCDESQASEMDAANNVRNMRDFARPVIGAATSCIVLGEAARNYELKNIHFNQLPSFYGMPAEDALNFIREFYAVVQTFPLQGLNEDQLKMRCFPYTLKDRAKTWFMSLPPNSLANWNAVYEKFMAKYYSNQKTQDLRAQIVTFAQTSGESFHEAWDRFRNLQQQCPHHHLPAELLNQFFYDGLLQNFQYMVDNAAGGDIGNHTAEEVSDIFETMATNSQQKSARGKGAATNEATPSYDVTRQLAELTRKVELLSSSERLPKQIMSVETCGNCGEFGHDVNLCTRWILPNSSEQVQAQAMQGFQPNWRNNPSFAWNQNQNQSSSQGPQYTQPQYQQPAMIRPQHYSNQQAPPPKPSLEDALQAFIQSSQQRFESVEASVKRIEIQMEQLNGTVGELVQQNQDQKKPVQHKQVHAVTVLASDEGDEPIVHEKKPPRVFVPPIPFPSRLMRKTQKDEKILKDGVEEKNTQHQPPPKQHDPGSFVLNLAFGNGKQVSGMLDLGAGVNLMSYAVFRQLQLGDLKPTRLRLQLADGTVRYPKGMIEDVLVRVGKLLISTDFVILDMVDGKKGKDDHTLLLGRPFMATTSTLIDVKDGTIKMTVLGETESFPARNVKAPFTVAHIANCSSIIAFNPLVEDTLLQEQDPGEDVDEGSEHERGIEVMNRVEIDCKEIPSQPPPPHPPEKRQLLVENLWIRRAESLLLDTAWFD